MHARWPASVPLDPGSLFVTNAELDFTFCGVSGLEHLGVVPVERDGHLIMPSEYVNIIQHPRGRPKEVALQDNRVVKVDHVVVHYSCDTEPGSSGSPVFDNQWRLVALHHASVATDAASGGRAAWLARGWIRPDSISDASGAAGENRWPCTRSIPIAWIARKSSCCSTPSATTRPPKRRASSWIDSRTACR